MSTPNEPKPSLPRPEHTTLPLPAELASLVERRDMELFRSPLGEPMAGLPDGRCFLIGSKAFRQELTRAMLPHAGRTPKKGEIPETIDLLAATALGGELEYPVAVRYHFTPHEAFLDLGDASGTVIKISAGGWEKVPCRSVPVRFARPRGALSLPRPERGGKLEDLRCLLNVSTDEQWALCRAWLIGSLGPPPYTMLFVQGPQSAAKSSLCRLLRIVADARTDALRRPPRSDEDLMAAANSNRILAFDNVSEFKDWLSDSLCSIGEGEAMARRELYENLEESIVTGARPVIANGIPVLAGRSDLRDRSIVLELSALDAKRRKGASEVRAAFEAMHPKLLGALLDALMAAFARYEEIVPSVTARHIDMVRWCVAAEDSFNDCRGVFERALAENRAMAHDETLESSSLGLELLELMENREAPWVGTQTTLLAELNGRLAGPAMSDWPRSPRGLHDQLRRLEPALRAKGVILEFEDRAGHAHIRRLWIRREASDAPRGNSVTGSPSPKHTSSRDSSSSSEVVPPASSDPTDASSSSSAGQPNGGPPPVTSSFASLAGVIGEEYDKAYKRARPWR